MQVVRRMNFKYELTKVA